MAVLGVVIGLDRTHSHRLYHIMYLTPPPPHLTHACPRTLINHLAFLHRASLATILQHDPSRTQRDNTRFVCSRQRHVVCRYYQPPTRSPHSSRPTATLDHVNGPVERSIRHQMSHRRPSPARVSPCPLYISHPSRPAPPENSIRSIDVILFSCPPSSVPCMCDRTAHSLSRPPYTTRIPHPYHKLSTV